MIFYPSRIPWYPGVKKAPDLESRIRNTGLTFMNFIDSCLFLFRGPAATVISARPHKQKTMPAERLLLLPLSSLQDNNDGGDGSARGDRCTTPPTPG
jgi:hypothetical protein